MLEVICSKLLIGASPLCRASSWGKIKACFLKQRSSVVGAAVSSRRYLLVYFEVQCAGCSAQPYPPFQHGTRTSFFQYNTQCPSKTYVFKGK